MSPQRQEQADAFAVERDRREQESGLSFDDALARFVRLGTELIHKTTERPPFVGSRPPVFWTVTLYVLYRRPTLKFSDVAIRETGELWARIFRPTGAICEPSAIVADLRRRPWIMSCGNVFDADPALMCTYDGPRCFKNA